MKPLLRVNALLRAIVGVVMVVCCGIVGWWWQGPRRDPERRSTCASNLKSIGLSFMQYTQDWDERLPRAWFGKDAGPSDYRTNYKWMDAILPYAKTEAIFLCPSDSVNNAYHVRAGANYGSYVYNNAYYLPGDKYTSPAGAAQSAIAEPATTVLLMDGEHDFEAAWPDVAHTPALVARDMFHLGSITMRHSRTSFIAVPLFCDGHIEGNPSDYVLQPKVIHGHTVYTGLTIEPD